MENLPRRTNRTDRLLPYIPIGTYRIVHGNLLLLFSHDEFLFTFVRQAVRYEQVLQI
jgi:hypothetical protein